MGVLVDTLDPGATMRATSKVLRERESQDKKWGKQRHAWADWHLILLEEVGEFATELLMLKFDHKDPTRNKASMEALHENYLRARAEVVQVAAVATAIVEHFDEVLRDGAREGLGNVTVDEIPDLAAHLTLKEYTLLKGAESMKKHHPEFLKDV